MIYSNSFEYFFLATCSMDIPCLESNNKEATIDGLQPATAYLFEISVTTDSNDLDSMSITKKCKTRPPKLTGTMIATLALTFISKKAEKSNLNTRSNLFCYFLFKKLQLYIFFNTFIKLGSLL